MRPSPTNTKKKKMTTVTHTGITLFTGATHPSKKLCSRHPYDLDINSDASEDRNLQYSEQIKQ